MNEPSQPSQVVQLLVLAIIAAVCAALVGLAFLGVRPAPITLSRFGGVAAVIWVVMLIVGVWLPWALARLR
ncbi:MAG: hypothetical protein DMF89_17600 [Acidobacteria bacterium]|nr:MAG: hypothetical protein DMF89_17600 [Acidobacteriota bacterium]